MSSTTKNVLFFGSPLSRFTFSSLLSFYFTLRGSLILFFGLYGSLAETSESKVGFVSKVSSRVSQKLRSSSVDEDEGIELSKDLKAHKIFIKEASLWDSGKSLDEVSDQL
ncbi:SBP-type domain-containing protein [Psidium guajava]|nr:SBP-type domain-containing protein [Psidium guajava]